MNSTVKKLYDNLKAQGIPVPDEATFWQEFTQAKEATRKEHKYATEAQRFWWAYEAMQNKYSSASNPVSQTTTPPQPQPLEVRPHSTDTQNSIIPGQSLPDYSLPDYSPDLSYAKAEADRQAALNKQQSELQEQAKTAQLKRQFELREQKKKEDTNTGNKTTDDKDKDSTQQPGAPGTFGLGLGLDLGLNPWTGQAPGAESFRQQQLGLVEQAASQQAAANEASAYAQHRYAPTILAQAGDAARQAALQNSGNTGAGAAAMAGLQAATNAQQQALPGATQQDIQREQHWNQQAYDRAQAGRDTSQMALGAQRAREQLERLFQSDQAYNRAAGAHQDTAKDASTAGTNTEAFSKRDPNNNVDNSQKQVDTAITGAGQQPVKKMTTPDLRILFNNDKATEKDIEAWGIYEGHDPTAVAILKKWLSYINTNKARGNVDAGGRVRGAPTINSQVIEYALKGIGPPKPIPGKSQEAANIAAGKDSRGLSQAPTTPGGIPGQQPGNNTRKTAGGI